MGGGEILHPDHLKQRLTTKQLQGWKQYNSIEPFGQARIELKLAEILQYLYNSKRNPETKPEPWEIDDFAPWVPKYEEPELSPEECFNRIDKEIFGL